jgi:hypothetical protein
MNNGWPDLIVWNFPALKSRKKLSPNIALPTSVFLCFAFFRLPHDSESSREAYRVAPGWFA